MTDIRDGQLRRSMVPVYSGLRMATPDGYSGLLRTIPDGYAGHRGSRYPPQGPAWASGKLPTRLPVSPVPVQFTSTFAGLGRDSLINNGGGSSLCWSVACALRPPDPN